MADDERAAKAARAKALLKRRQQKKAAGPINGTSQSQERSTSPSISRALSPAPSNVDDTFIVKDNLLSTEDVAATPEDQTGSHIGQLQVEGKIPPEDEKKFESIGNDSSDVIKDQKQTIALLVSEKAALAQDLVRLTSIESKFLTSQAESIEAQTLLAEVKTKLSMVEEERHGLSSQLEGLRASNVSQASQLRDEERERNSLRGELEKLSAIKEERDKHIRDLEEQIQKDDRVEILETKLKHTQDRAEEIAFQLSKLKKTSDVLRREHEASQTALRNETFTKENLAKEVEGLQNTVSSLELKLRQALSDCDELGAAKSTLKDELDECTQSFKSTKGKNDQLVSELAAAVRAEEAARAETRAAIHRAEEAEKAQRDLQEEGSRLMLSLDEMRPKFVELTGLKLDLTEKTDALTLSLKERDSTIADLERELEMTREAALIASQERGQVENKWLKEKANTEKSLDELQKAYADLQQELEESMASTRELDSERKSQRQSYTRLQEEIDVIKARERAQGDELVSLQARLDEQQRAGQESETLLEQLQADVESLRTELANRDAEINRLRQSASSSPPSPHPQSLDGEVQKALKQQYDFDLSTAQSTIRDLESQLYDAENHYHALQKQYVSTEEELRQLRAIMANQKPQAMTSREFGLSHRADDLRRTSFGSQRSGSLPRITPSVRIDENLPPAIRHQRHVSLAMLQARMASEAEVVANATRVHGSPRAVPSSIEEIPSRSSLDSSIPSFKRPQFLDESHVFWCASCKGDLIIL